MRESYDCRHLAGGLCHVVFAMCLVFGGAARAQDETTSETELEVEIEGTPEVASSVETDPDVVVAVEPEPEGESEQETDEDEELAPNRRPGGVPHCHGQDQATWVIHDSIGVRTNSLGLSNTLRGSYCWPLFADREGIMWALSNVEVGFVNHLAPVFLHLGAYASFTPISLLSIGVEVTGFYTWPLSLSNSGYIPRTGYDHSLSSSGLVQNPTETDEPVEDAFGLNVVLNLTARGRVTLTQMRRGALNLLISDTLAFEFWQSGDSEYYWNVKSDAILQTQDWFMTNQAVVLLGIPVTERHNLRVGLFDELLYALGDPGLQRHQVGGLIGVVVSTLGRRMRNFEALLIVSGITNLPIRDLTIPPINILMKISFPIPLV